MATTLQNIMTTLRAANIVPTAKVNYGRTDNLVPPYINVFDYSHTITYHTAGAAFKDSMFKVLIIDKSQDDAEDLAILVDAELNLQPVTATTVLCTQAGYKVGQMEEQLYQFGVELTYELQESM